MFVGQDTFQTKPGKAGELIDKFKAAHRLLKKKVTKQMMADPAVVPFHPGAAKYLREAGLLR